MGVPGPAAGGGGADQLIGGAQQGQVSYELAVSLLGFTPEALLNANDTSDRETPTARATSCSCGPSQRSSKRSTARGVG